MTEQILRSYGKIINRMDWKQGELFVTNKLYFYENKYYLVQMQSGIVIFVREVEFTDYTKIGDDMITKTCCICGKEFTGFGNNPDPVCKEGRCCDECNSTVVVPTRLKECIK